MSRDPFLPHILEYLSFEPQRVVVLRASRIGDFLCAVPALRALRQRLPRAEITLITIPSLLEYARRLPYVDRVWSFPGFPGLAEQLFEARSTVRFLHHAQENYFDLAIQMQGTGVYSNPFTLLLGARITAGFVRPGDTASLLDAALPYPENVHEIRCVLSLTTFLGAPSSSEDLEFPLQPRERAAATNLLARWPRPWIGIHASARDYTRQWPLDRFAALAQQLLRHYGGTIVILGDEEAVPGSRMLEHCLQPACLNLSGKLSLLLLGAIIDQLAVIVTSDSGPAHIAYTLQTPTITLFGRNGSPQTNGPLQPGPFSLLVADAESTKQPLSSDIRALSVAQVLAATETLLDARSGYKASDHRCATNSERYIASANGTVANQTRP